MHSSRVPTASLSGYLSCMPPCHSCPHHTCPTAMHAPCHACPLSCMPPVMHAPCHACPLSCMPPLPHTPSFSTHAPFTMHAPLFHAHPTFATHAPFAMHTYAMHTPLCHVYLRKLSWRAVNMTHRFIFIATAPLKNKCMISSRNEL